MDIVYTRGRYLDLSPLKLNRGMKDKRERNKPTRRSVNDYTCKQLKKMIETDDIDDGIFGKEVITEYFITPGCSPRSRPGSNNESFMSTSSSISGGSSNCYYNTVISNSISQVNNYQVNNYYLSPRKRKNPQQKKKMKGIMKSCARLFQVFNKKRAKREKKNTPVRKRY